MKAGLNSVCVSIDSPGPAPSTTRMRGTPGALKQTVAGVRELRAGKQHNVTLPIFA